MSKSRFVIGDSIICKFNGTTGTIIRKFTSEILGFRELYEIKVSSDSETTIFRFDKQIILNIQQARKEKIGKLLDI